LDRFKNINDTVGHAVGDLLLKAVSERLQSCLGEALVISRQGGDEFTIILQDINKVETEKVAQRIIDHMAEPFLIEENEIYISTSIGISMFPSDGNDQETLMKNADTAMYHAKEKGRNNFQFFTAKLNEVISRKMKLEKNLRKALGQKEFEVHYQPKYNIQSGSITGMEALIRWRSPEYGMISPMEFIPLAEESGLIIPLGEWILYTACAQNKKWQDEGNLSIPVAVNLSARQFQHPGFVDTVDEVLRETCLDPKYLELEITESIAMNDVRDVIAKLKSLKNLGIKISIDDFGTGYSSLSYLHKFPIDALKIDKSFINDINNDSDDTTIVKTIISMAHNLKLDVIAEGVEKVEQLWFLKKNSCDQVQGYLYSPPIPAKEFSEFLMKSNVINFAKRIH